ncbi:MAG TPA: glycosyltransferase family 4 protein [Gemmatimonadota bacterium]|nr:glycosyltransferase family 4 protein [Gemmatimonadota bacterium]
MKRPIRILYTIPNFITAGSGRAMMNVVEGLDRDAFEPSVCVFRKGGKLDALVESLDIPLFEARFTAPAFPRWAFPRAAWEAARPLRVRRFDLIHSFHYDSDYSEPIVARLAGAKGWVYTKKNMGWDKRWNLRSSLAAGIGAQNRDMLRTFFAPRRLARKVRLIPPSVDERRYRPDPAARAKVRARLGIPDGAFLVSCVAHLIPVKGHPTLLQAAAELPGLHVVLAGREGDADYARGLRRQAHDAGMAERVHFTGEIDYVPDLLAGSDAMVLPTVPRFRMEGCPVAMLEAMACGSTCVATDIPGARDVVETGRNGILVAPEDPAALIAALRELESSPGLGERLGREGRRTIEDGYTMEREVRQYEEMYRGILD